MRPAGGMLIVLGLALLAGVGVVAWLIRSVLPRTLACAVRHRRRRRQIQPAAVGRRPRRDRPARPDPAVDGPAPSTGAGLRLHPTGVHRKHAAHRNRTGSPPAAAALPAPLHPRRRGGHPQPQQLRRPAPSRHRPARRLAATGHPSRGGSPLLACPVCSECPGSSTWTPFLVGGEVIGSVLITRAEPLDPEHQRRARESVIQTAPVLANLRNLATVSYTHLTLP